MGKPYLIAKIHFQAARLWRWIAPPVPQSIVGPLHSAQLQNVRTQVPMLLAVAALNTCIVMAVCWSNGLPLANYAWMSGLILYCFARLTVWRRLLQKPISLEKVPRIIKANVGLSVGMMGFLGIAASVTYVAGTFAYETLIPVSLAFGATAIAHCLYTLRPAAIGVLVIGITPVALSMIFAGEFNAKMLGVSMLSVEALMIRFVAAQYDRLIEGLFLEQQIRELADTDPLTSLPNRRAIMASIEAELECGADQRPRFGIALLDLDGFKQVNDSLGHHAGDLMLLGVGGRLADAAEAQDSVGRLGGDEFIVLFRNVVDKAELSARTTSMLAALCRPIDLDGSRLPVAASLGYALYPEDGETVREVMHVADAALYAEKRAGKVRAQAVASSQQRAA
ncbi:sensor domain-containing diguanylate cyclase [Sphingorhabdus pulchriflava]|uniref:Sensor domain-containing diguanylate cyclase n=1 Tax=Sphingorhabdus pulchriflava TaxID=2292257 RepID=A0A371B2G8_9SPHN|nr:diguanylate cyclase [Sphingorhabdus pulchriflava]RDV01643.1 sensor domain-containing diguanylate cyclase [Sphingorhabdus pulchriflava]